MSELTREQFEYYLQCMHGNYDVRSMAEPYLKAHDAALRAQLAACEKELPDTWYVDKPLGERLAMLITQWQKALRINTELEQQLAAVTKERDEWKRLYAHRGEALKRACLQCGYTQKEMKHHG